VELGALARQLAERLPPLAREVVLTGSTSRGVADEHSDIELLVVVEELPPLAECVRAAEEAGLEEVGTWTPPGAPAYWSGGLLAGEFAELIWWPRAYVEQRIDDILAADAFEHQRLRTAEALVHGTPLRSGGALARWRERLAVYPDALASRVIDDAAEAWHDLPRSSLGMLRDGDRLVLARQLVEDAEGVLRILFALNRAWEPGWKRIAVSLESLELKPERTAGRIEEALTGLDLRTMRELVRDTLALAPETRSVAQARRQTSALLEELR
jgi:predicted nucleotidyltransferase